MLVVSRNADHQRHRAGGVETRIDLDQAAEAAQEQRGPGDQHQGQRDVRGDQRPPQSPGPRPGRGAAPAQDFLQLRLGGGERREKAEQHPARQRRSQPERQHRSVDADLARPGQVRPGREEQIDAPDRHRDAQRPSQDREEEAFHQHLPHQLRTARAQSQPDAAFVLTRFGLD